MKRLLSFTLAAVMLAVLIPFSVFAEDVEIWDGSVASGFSSGDGGMVNPYIINSGAELAYLAEQVNNGDSYYGVYFKLGADIYLNDTSAENWEETANPWTPIGYSEYDEDNGVYEYINYFKGNFDGDGHTVFGVYINDTARNDAALFGDIYGASISNLNVEAYIFGGEYVGGIVGHADSSTLQYCRVTGGIIGSMYVGSIAGSMYNSDVVSCENLGVVGGYYYVGGIVGVASGEDSAVSSISACVNNGIITTVSEDEAFTEFCFGGIMGYGYYMMITNCANHGYVIGDDAVGGIVGAQYCESVYCSYNAGYVSGVTAVGGITGTTMTEGMDSEFAVYECYNVGTVEGDVCVGALVGADDGVCYAYCSYALEGTATYSFGGWYNPDDNSYYDYAYEKNDAFKTDAEMQTEAAYAGFDFYSTWSIDPAADYPYPTLNDVHYHEFSIDGFDETFHWIECVCGVVGDIAEHIPAEEWEVVTEATDKTEGLKVLRCSECGYIMESETIPVIQTLRGDVDGNGEVKTADYIILKRILLGSKDMDTLKYPETAFDRCDVNANGEVKTNDYILLKRALLGAYQIPE